MSKPIHVLSGPNLNLLGVREPEIYGRESLEDVRALCEAKAKAHGREVVFRQSNHEGELIDWVQEARQGACALVINPAGYGHTSIALLDALKALAPSGRANGSASGFRCCGASSSTESSSSLTIASNQAVARPPTTTGSATTCAPS